MTPTRSYVDRDLDRLADEAEAGYDLSEWKPRRGRPHLGGRSATQHSPRLGTRLPDDLNERFHRCVAADGKSVSQVLRELVEAYVEDRDRTP